MCCISNAAKSRLFWIFGKIIFYIHIENAGIKKNKPKKKIEKFQKKSEKSRKKLK